MALEKKEFFMDNQSNSDQKKHTSTAKEKCFGVEMSTSIAEQACKFETAHVVLKSGNIVDKEASAFVKAWFEKSTAK